MKYQLRKWDVGSEIWPEEDVAIPHALLVPFCKAMYTNWVTVVFGTKLTVTSTFNWKRFSDDSCFHMVICFVVVILYSFLFIDLILFIAIIYLFIYFVAGGHLYLYPLLIMCNKEKWNRGKVLNIWRKWGAKNAWKVISMSNLNVILPLCAFPTDGLEKGV